MYRLLLILACFMLAGLPVYAQDTTDPLVTSYMVGEGDVLKITVYDEANLSGSYPIDDGGVLDMPLLGRVRVAGNTADQVATKLTRLLSQDFLVDPQVSVVVETFGSQVVQVLGAVRSPGPYPLTGLTTVLDMIGQAGGVTDKSSGEVQVKRARTGEVLPLTINMERLLSTGEGNVSLQDGDVVYVPESVYVYVAGEVTRPGSVDWRDGLTVSQAITAAGGPTPGADTRKIYVLREGSQFTINLKRIRRGSEQDPPVRPGDQIHVDRSVF